MFLRKFQISFKGSQFAINRVVNFDRILSKSLLSNKSVVSRQFCSKKAKDSEQEEDQKELQKELEETEEEVQRKKNVEEMKKMMAAVYTQEEINEINESGREIIFNEIREKNKKKLILAKKLSIYLNIPLSIALIFLIDYLFGDNTELPKKKKSLYYLSLFFDYHLFIVGITILVGCRNIVTQAKYIPREKMIQFTKLNMFCKPYTVKEKVGDLVRVNGGKMTPFMSLKNKATYSIYSMNSVGEWKDRKIYNALYPPPVRKEKTKNKKDFDKDF